MIRARGPIRPDRTQHDRAQSRHAMRAPTEIASMLLPGRIGSGCTVLTARRTASAYDAVTVAGRLDDAALVLGDGRVDQFMAQRLEARQRASLVQPYEPAVANNVSRQDRDQLSFDCVCRHRRGLPARHYSSAASERRNEHAMAAPNGYDRDRKEIGRQAWPGQRRTTGSSAQMRRPATANADDKPPPEVGALQARIEELTTELREARDREA